MNTLTRPTAVADATTPNTRRAVGGRVDALVGQPALGPTPAHDQADRKPNDLPRGALVDVTSAVLRRQAPVGAATV